MKYNLGMQTVEAVYDNTLIQNMHMRIPAPLRPMLYHMGMRTIGGNILVVCVNPVATRRYWRRWAGKN